MISWIASLNVTKTPGVIGILVPQYQLKEKKIIQPNDLSIEIICRKKTWVPNQFYAVNIWKEYCPKESIKALRIWKFCKFSCFFIKMIALVLWHIFFTRTKFLKIALKTQFALRSIKLMSIKHTLERTSEVSHHLVWICVMNT